ncbi:MAG: hypothetical protein B6I23_03400 [Rickettsiaceae bacterium 4572_127]|nr:MAG: hypothetical protein B6I23_03400 [Rickettsiaceae bacterium 4572_127]
MKNYITEAFASKVDKSISMDFLRKRSNMSIEHFETPKTNDLIQRANYALPRIPHNFSVIFYLISYLVSVVVSFSLLTVYGFWVPLLAIATIVPGIFIVFRYTKKFFNQNNALVSIKRKSGYFQSIFSDLSVLQETKIVGGTKRLLNQTEKIKTTLHERWKKALLSWYKPRFFVPLYEEIILFCLILFFVPKVLSAEITIGHFTLLLAMLSSLKGNTRGSVRESAKLMENSLFFKDFFEFLDLKPTLDYPKNGMKFKDFNSPTIEFKKVSFNYPNGQKVFSNISFKIKAGEQVAFVGENGAGKTTLIKLLCRFYDPTKGEVLINGINLKELDITNWHRHLGLLTQTFAQYRMTPRENITMGDPLKKFDKKRMELSAKLANADKMINEFKNGYNQQIGREFDKGIGLSGGQWQKLALARAFYGDKPIMILDEPTSAVDAEAEYDIFENLKKHTKGKTILFVSHRFSTVRHANKIIVIDKGKILEQGTHKELMTKKKIYAKLFKIQSKGYK